MSQIRVLLADDHTLVRSGFRALLDQLEGVDVVGEAADGREALRLVGQHRPHIVLMDITMPELNGLQATEQITRQFPEVRVLLLSMHASDEYVSEAFAAGAAGYMVKGAGAVELAIAIRAVARGESFLSPAVVKHVVSQDTPPSSDRSAGLRGRLTPRHREILQLIAESNSTKEIARKLEVSVKTVETHRRKLMYRLDIHDVAGLVRYAIRMGLVAPDA